MAFRSDSTGTYTFPVNSTGSTVDLGAKNTYRYVNAVNVYATGAANGGKYGTMNRGDTITLGRRPKSVTFFTKYVATDYYYFMGYYSETYSTTHFVFMYPIYSGGYWNQGCIADLPINTNNTSKWNTRMDITDTGFSTNNSLIPNTIYYSVL